jgi:hypothetical protein
MVQVAAPAPERARLRPGVRARAEDHVAPAPDDAQYDGAVFSNPPSERRLASVRFETCALGADAGRRKAASASAASTRSGVDMSV